MKIIRNYMNWIRIIDEIEKNFPDESIAKRLNVRSQFISDLKSGKSKNPGGDFVLRLIDIYKINPAWLLSKEGEMFSTENSTLPATATQKIPLLKQTASCGPGQEWGDADMIEEYIEPLALVPSLKNAKVFAFRVRGTSMIGAGLHDGDIVLFDGRETSSYIDDLYVFTLDGSVYCKWLKFDTISRRIHIYSVHNIDLEKAELLKTIDTTQDDDTESFRIFGRILAWVRENKLVYR